MANAKIIRIEGDLNTMGLLGAAAAMPVDPARAKEEAVTYSNVPEDAVGAALATAPVVRDFMANSVVPYFGLKLRFTGKVRAAGNKVGGRVEYLGYVIEGIESVSWAYVNYLVDALSNWGNVDENSVVEL